MSEPERYGTCSDANGHWGIEDDGKVILSGLVSHDACDAVMDILDERDALKAEVKRLTKAGDAMEMTLQADFNGCPYEPIIVREAMIYWRNAKNAAKKGGQS